MKKYLIAVIFTCIGALFINLNRPPVNPPVTESPIVSQTSVESLHEPITPEPSITPAEPVQAIVEPVAPPAVSNQNGRCGDNDYAHAIYMQESGCRLDAMNSIGACGLGQSLPCSKMSSVCPDWRTNYDCQNQWFTNYAMQYGSWAEAYNFKFCKWSCYSTRTKTTVNKNGEPWW